MCDELFHIILRAEQILVSNMLALEEGKKFIMEREDELKKSR